MGLILSEEWKSAEKHIERALKYNMGEESLPDIWMKLTRQEYQLWSSPNAAAITRIVQYPQIKVCRGVYSGGKGKEIVKIIKPQIEKWAKEIGCNRIEVIGRKGWARWFDDFEQSKAVMLYKDI